MGRAARIYFDPHYAIVGQCSRKFHIRTSGLLFVSGQCGIETNTLIREFQKLRRLLVLFVGVTIAAVITPNGPFSALKSVQLMRDPALGNIDEWHPPDFQKDRFHLISIVGLFALLAYFGIRLRGPRLLTLLLVTVFALEHERGLGLFALVAPLLIVRPLSECVPWIGVQDP